MDTITLTADDGADLDVLQWTPTGTVRGIVQIVPGITEYAARYDEFASKLAADGWFVVSSDHRGHGPRALANGDLGRLPDRGYHQLLDDLSLVADDARSRYPGLPWVVVGHSMGSFLVRILAAQRGRDMAALVVIGTGGPLGALTQVGITLATAQVVLLGEDSRSPLLDTLTFGSYNQGFHPARTKWDWLSRDRRQVDAYIADPLCGFVCSAGYYRELIRMSAAANSVDVMRATPPRLPVGLFSGALDPVGGAGRGVRHVARNLAAHGVKHVDLRLFGKDRHEILNEQDRPRVQAEIIDWIDRAVES